MMMTTQVSTGLTMQFLKAAGAAEVVMEVAAGVEVEEGEAHRQAAIHVGRNLLTVGADDIMRTEDGAVAEALMTDTAETIHNALCMFGPKQRQLTKSLLFRLPTGP